MIRKSDLLPTHNRESGSIALASLSTVLVLCDAAIGGQSVFLLHLRDVQSAKWGQEEPVTCGGGEGEEGSRICEWTIYDNDNNIWQILPQITTTHWIWKENKMD